MLIRFYSIEWSGDATSESLPSSVTMEVEDGIDAGEIEMNGSEILEEEFGIPVDSYEWEHVDAEDEEVFSFDREE